MSRPLLEVTDLATHFFTRGGVVKAVDGISFTLEAGKVVGLVGESGSGKSVTGYSLLGLVDPPGRVVSGSVMFEGQDLTRLDGQALRTVRGRRISMVFQDATSTLNPVLTVGDQMMLAVHAHQRVSDKAGRALALEALGKVGIPDPGSRLKAYPHQLSGGMRQRVAIAIALLHRPALVIADEPTTALDVSVQAQIIHEMRELVRTSGTAVIWITHDLATVSSLADDILVMYAGRVVEAGPTRTILRDPRHPYTQGLLDSVPSRNTPGGDLPQIPGSTPSLLSLPPGCPFAPRCHAATTACEVMPRRELRRHTQLPLPQSQGDSRMSAPILELDDVSKRFDPRLTMGDRIAARLGGDVETRSVQAVRAVSLALSKGETLGLVGESGCGKSTLGRIAAGIMRPTSGAVRLDGKSVMDASGAKLTTRIQTVFQDPFASLNPRIKVGETICRGPHRAWLRPRRARASPTRRNGSTSWGSTPATPSATRTSSPAASGSASPLPGRSP